jgi:hypothetical protein
MSALQRQTYANTDEALFVKTGGNSFIDGDISAKYITARSGFSLLDNSSPQTQVLSIACATNNPGGDPILQVNPTGAIRFGQVGQATANTEILPTAPGVNADVLLVGGTTNTLKLQLGNQSCGQNTILVGATNAVVPSTAVTATSKIFLSFYGSPSAGPGAGPSQGSLIVNPALIVPGVSFRVDHTDETGVSVAVSNTNCTFNWLIIQ